MMESLKSCRLVERFALRLNMFSISRAISYESMGSFGFMHSLGVELMVTLSLYNGAESSDD
jgi:hypothetical protein